MNVKEILICNSNMFVPLTLSEILENPHKKYIIISDTPNIITFFKSCQLDNIITYQYSSGKLSNIKNEKRKILQFLSNFNIKKIIFFHAEYGELANWLLIYYSHQKTPIEYYKIFESLNFPRAKLYQGVKIRLKQFIAFHYWPNILNDGHNYLPALPKSFYKKINATIIKKESNNILLNDFIKQYTKKINLEGNIVLLNGCLVEEKVIEEKEYIKITENIVNIIGLNNLILKLHPRYKNKYGLETQLKEIPSYIPGNLLINNYNLFIGCYSTLLVEAAHEGKKAISYLYLLTGIDKQFVQHTHQYLLQRLNNKGIIYFPQTIEEFKSLIILNTRCS